MFMSWSIATGILDVTYKVKSWAYNLLLDALFDVVLRALDENNTAQSQSSQSSSHTQYHQGKSLQVSVNTGCYL